MQDRSKAACNLVRAAAATAGPSLVLITGAPAAGLASQFDPGVSPTQERACLLTEADHASPAQAGRTDPRSQHTAGSGRCSCTPRGSHEQMCSTGYNQSPPCSPCRVPRSSALSATPSQRPETCGESTCELATPGRPCLERPTCPACDVTPPLVHTYTQVSRVHTCTHKRTHTCTHTGLEPEWRLRPRPCLLAPTKIGDHTCSRFRSQDGAGRWG